MRIAFASFLACLLVGLWLAPLDAWLDAAGAWAVAHPVAAAAWYLVFATLAAALFVPGSVIAMSAGYVYGFVIGTPFALLGLSTGALVAFLSGRLLVRRWVLEQMSGHPRLMLLDRAVNEQSFLLIVLTRLSLILPFNLLNYAFGATGVKKTTYFFATALGMVPAAALWTYVGTLAKDLVDIRSGRLDTGLPGGYLVLIGLVMLAAIVFVVHRSATRVLEQHLEK